MKEEQALTFRGRIERLQNAARALSDIAGILAEETAHMEQVLARPRRFDKKPGKPQR